VSTGTRPGRSGTGFGADLYKLWRVGRDNLPTVAAIYAQACNDLAATQSGLPAAFAGSAPFGGADTLQAWADLRDAVQGILADTATGLELAGEALCTAADAYARADAQAAAEYRRLVRDDGSVPEISVPAPVRPGGWTPQWGQR